VPAAAVPPGNGGPSVVPAPPVVAPTDPVDFAPSALHRPIASIFENLHGNETRLFSAEAEYLLWFMLGSHTNNPITSTDVLGQNVVAELSDNDRKRGPTSGGRLTLGYWQYERNPWIAQGLIRTGGVELRGFFVAGTGANITVDSPPDLFRPFFDLNNRAASGFLVASPGIATGQIDARGQVSIWGLEANAWKNLCYDRPGTTWAFDCMAGLRYMNLLSSFDINSISTFNPAIDKASPFAPFAGNRLQVHDSFDTRNNFLGGQVGIGAKFWACDFLSFESTFRLALGGNQQEVTINGNQVRNFASGATTNSTGGLLALPTNIGSHSHVQFSQIPEGTFKGVWTVNQQFSISVGFTALYWNRVARAGNQIDRSIDITQIPNFPGAAGATPTGLGRPTVLFQQSDLWLLGISLGAEYRW
jgi:hypothetical protein